MILSKNAKNSRPLEKGRELTRVATLVEGLKNAFHLITITAFNRKYLLTQKAFHTLLQDGFTKLSHRFPPAIGSL